MVLHHAGAEPCSLTEQIIVEKINYPQRNEINYQRKTIKNNQKTKILHPNKNRQHRSELPVEEKSAKELLGNKLYNLDKYKCASYFLTVPKS